MDDVLNYVRKELIKAAEMRPDLPKGHSSYDLLKMAQIPQLSIRLKQTLLDLSPIGSQYWKFANSLNAPFNYISVANLHGTLLSLREDYANDYLYGFNEILDAELFSDILEQAEYLLSEGYVRASTVVAGVALESHIRKLAEKNSISIKNNGSYVRAESLNNDLYKNGIIDKTINKSITSWLGLRNDAAHPDSGDIEKGLIEPMIIGIRVFIEKYPA
jgi:hypothetical protein